MALSRSLFLLLAALPLAGCPQDLVGVEADGGEPADADYAPPQCTGGPQVECVGDSANPGFVLVKDKLVFHCQLPGPRAKDGALPMLDRSVPSDHPEVVLGASVDSTTGEVVLQPQSVTSASFTGAQLTAWLTAYWEGDRNACTSIPLFFQVVGNLWAADQERGKIYVLDSGGNQIGEPLSVDGIAQPRLLAAVHQGEVLVGGTTSGRTGLVVLDHSGRKLKDLPKADVIGAPLRAAAGVGAVTFLSSGTLTTGGTLHLSESEGAPAWNATLAGGLAANDTTAFVGLVNARGYKMATSSQIPAQVNDLPYQDADGDACNVQATTAIVHLEAGGFVFASRHAHGTSGTPDTAPLGLLAWTDESRRIKAVLRHRHAALPGSLSADGPYDWLAELRPGLVVGTRDDRPGIERIDLTKLASDDAPVSTWAGALSGVRIKGLAKLR